MDEAKEETTGPISELALECEKLFWDHRSTLKKESDLIGFQYVEEYQTRFSIWTAYYVVFPKRGMCHKCLDCRVHSRHTEIKDKVVQLLRILQDTLAQRASLIH